MLNNQALMTVSDSLAPLHVDPAFAGAVVKKITMRHPEDADFDPNHIRGVHVTFANGMVLSIQWGGSGNYSNIGRGFWKPGDAPEFETAAWYPAECAEDLKGEWFCPELNGPYDRDAAGELGVYDSVQAYQSVAQVLATARIVAAHAVVEVL